MTDRSLDEFVTPSESVADEEAGDADADSDAPDADSNATPTDPATPTMRWTADAVCDACGSPAAHRWLDGDSYVCTDCKEW